MSKPRKGANVYYKGELVGQVLSVEGNLCWVNYPDSMGGPNPFIWRFLEQGEYVLNNLHDWDGKNEHSLRE